jgi:hypothetical protein
VKGRENSRVAEKTLESLLDEEFVDDRSSTSSIGNSDTLLDDVRRELLSREGRNVSKELTDDSLDETVVVQIENVLDDVVTLREVKTIVSFCSAEERKRENQETYESVLNESERVVGNLGNELDTLTLGSVIDTALEDATSVTVSSDFNAVGSDRVVDELVVFRREVVEALLNDVVSVEILDESNDVKVEGEDETLNLTLGREEVDHFLNGAGSVHVERDRNEFTSDRLDEGVTLFVGGVFEKALSEVVGERIRHELGEMGEDFVEDHVSVFWVTILELLLEVSATELILAEREHVYSKEAGLRQSSSFSFSDSRCEDAKMRELTSLEIFEPETSETIRAHSSRVPVTSRTESTTSSSTIVNESVRVVNVSSRSTSEERSGERVDNIGGSRGRESFGVEVELEGGKGRN